MKCRIHKIPLICYCPACRGAAKSAQKAESSRMNGLRGGRPRKAESQVTPSALYQRERREKLRAEEKIKKGGNQG